MTDEAVMIMGPPGCGKSTYTKRYVAVGYEPLNRDTLGGKIDGLVPKLEKLWAAGVRKFVLDNTYGTVQSRASAIAVCRKLGLPLRCIHIDADSGQAQFLASLRMIRRHGKLLDNAAIKALKGKDPNTFPPAAQFAYFKQFEPPTMAEGFASVEVVPSKIRMDPDEYKNKALLLDYDGTLRVSKSGEKWPTGPEDVELLPGRSAVLRDYQSRGYRLLGISNQSAVSRTDARHVSEMNVRAAFERTDRLLGVSIETEFCPHRGGVPQCYCRKPMPGLGVWFVERYRLRPSDCIYVGDAKTDATFAARCGFQFVYAEEFFRQ